MEVDLSKNCRGSEGNALLVRTQELAYLPENIRSLINSLTRETACYGLVGSDLNTKIKSDLSIILKHKTENITEYSPVLKSGII